MDNAADADYCNKCERLTLRCMCAYEEAIRREERKRILEGFYVRMLRGLVVESQDYGTPVQDLLGGC